ncbi:MAG: hypothetical protein JJE48_06705 [Actinobacteria bacterium]|nr:hypothetical protein [Actinomycetota bacterium]
MRKNNGFKPHVAFYYCGWIATIAGIMIGLEHHEIHDGNHYMLQDAGVLGIGILFMLASYPTSILWDMLDELEKYKIVKRKKK